MGKAFEWLLPALLLAEAALVWLDLLSVRDAALAAAGSYRTGRAAGLDTWRALEAASQCLSPGRRRGSS